MEASQRKGPLTSRSVPKVWTAGSFPWFAAACVLGFCFKVGLEVGTASFNTVELLLKVSVTDTQQRVKR